MTKIEDLQNLKSLIEEYHNLGIRIKDYLEFYNKEYGESYNIDEDKFFNYFAPLFGDTPEDFDKFKNYFVLN